MTYEELLVYAGRIGDLEEIQFCIEEKVDLASADASGNTALRNILLLKSRHGMCEWSQRYLRNSIESRSKFQCFESVKEHSSAYINDHTSI
jgi:hypothetical protein